MTPNEEWVSDEHRGMRRERIHGKGGELVEI